MVSTTCRIYIHTWGWIEEFMLYKSMECIQTKFKAKKIRTLKRSKISDIIVLIECSHHTLGFVFFIIFWLIFFLVLFGFSIYISKYFCMCILMLHLKEDIMKWNERNTCNKLTCSHCGQCEAVSWARGRGSAVGSGSVGDTHRWLDSAVRNMSVSVMSLLISSFSWRFFSSKSTRIFNQFKFCSILSIFFFNKNIGFNMQWVFLYLKTTLEAANLICILMFKA